MQSPVLLKSSRFTSSEYPDITVKDIQKYLVLTPVVEGKVNTKIIQVVYTDNDPIKTEKVLEAVNTFIKFTTETAGTAFKKGLKFINEQIHRYVSSLISLR